MADHTVDKATRHGGVTLRAVIVAVALVAFLSLLNPYNDEYRHNTLLAGNHFPIAPFFLLMVLTLVVNGFLALLSWLARRDWTFRPQELLVIWMLMVLGSGIPSSGLNRYLSPDAYAPFYHATPENQWRQKICIHIHDQLVPSTAREGIDEKAILDYHEGLRGGRDMGWLEVAMRVPWGSLARPFVAWSVLVLAVYLVMFSVCGILRRQWTERENLLFPLLELPKELVARPEPGHWVSRFLRSKAMWVGAALPVFVHLLNGLRVHYPKLPQFPTFFRIDDSLTEEFWRYFRPMNIHIWFSFIGIAFLLNKKVSLSFWFFFIFLKAQIAVLAWLGYLRTRADASPLSWGQVGGALPEKRQVFGAQLIWFLFILWLSRRHIKEGLVRAFRPRAGSRKSRFTPEFWAWFGLLLGGGGVIAWCWTYGVSVWAAAGFLALLLVAALIATRLICQAGLIFVQFNYTPVEPLFSAGFTLGGSQAFSPRSVVMLSMVNRVFARDIREIIMPSMMQGMKLGEDIRARRWRLYAAMALVILVALPLSWAAFHWCVYRYGAIDIGWWTFGSPRYDLLNRVNRVLIHADDGVTLTTNMKPVGWELFYIVVGMVVMGSVILMHRRFVWWPIHPAGYATANSWAMYNMWFPFFVGWLSKALVLRYGGPDAYKKWRDFFLGLIFGDMVMGGFWTLVNFILAEPGVRYNVLPM